MLEDAGGPCRTYFQGEEYDLDDYRALDLLRREVAEAVDPETASLSPPSCEEANGLRDRRPKRKQRKR